MSAPHVSVGDDVEVLIAQPFDWDTHTERMPMWTPGFRVTAINGASDRDYRVSVDGHRSIGHCAPECVRRIGGAE